MKLDKGTADLIRERIDAVRKMIKAEEIVEELQQCALGEKIMDKEQIKAAEILLKKSVPDMKQIEHTGPDGGPIQYQAVVNVSRSSPAKLPTS